MEKKTEKTEHSTTDFWTTLSGLIYVHVIGVSKVGMCKKVEEIWPKFTNLMKL